MKQLNKFIETNLRGVGQIMLQNNPWTGVLFLLGIFYNSWVMGVGAVIGVLAGTLTAIVAKFSQEDVNDGLYGFNGTLVGIAILFFYEFSLLSALLIVLFSILSSFIMYFMHTKKLSPYTFPFILSTWIAIFTINWFELLEKVVSSSVLISRVDFLSGISMGFGQVMFQGSIITGVIFLIGVFINSKNGALFGLIGSVVGLFAGMLMGGSVEMLTIGIFGYNAVLCAVAFSNDKKFGYISAIIASIVSVLILDGFVSLSLIALTAPFVFATWGTMFLRDRVIFKSV